MEIIKEISLMQARSNELRLQNKKIGFVPTMGALHEGHLSLVDVAKKHSDIVVMSIYLNPTQFNNKDDLKNYPADLEQDFRFASARGVDIVFCPLSEDIYPKGFQARVEVDGITKGLCGATRPGHFMGVATVVAKLFNIVMPHKAVFGEKDFQQLQVIRQLVKDLNFDIDIVPAPIVREKDGLAMSSRNKLLSPEAREKASIINRSLEWAEKEVKSGEKSAKKIISGVGERITGTGIGEIDYIKVCNLNTLDEISEISSPALLAIAAFFGNVRLIDNCLLSTND